VQFVGTAWGLCTAEWSGLVADCLSLALRSGALASVFKHWNEERLNEFRKRYFNNVQMWWEKRKRIFGLFYERCVHAPYSSEILVLMWHYITSQPGQLSLAIPLWAGTMSTSHRAVTVCCWRVKAGMFRLRVAGKTVWSPCYHGPYLSALEMRFFIIRCYTNRSYFTFSVTLVTERTRTHSEEQIPQQTQQHTVTYFHKRSLGSASILQMPHSDLADFIRLKLNFIKKNKNCFLSNPFGGLTGMQSIYSSLKSPWSTYYSS